MKVEVGQTYMWPRSKTIWIVEEIFQSRQTKHLLYMLVKEGSSRNMVAFVSTSQLKNDWTRVTIQVYKEIKNSNPFTQSNLDKT